MSNYNYHLLSPIEFETLAKDIIQKKENIILESFKEGKDSGIDFKYNFSPKRTLIVQVKRYKDDYDYLYRNLKEEVPKLDKLKPARFILVTSVGLTPKNKENIKKLFNNHIRSTEDIIGKDDVDNLISLYPDIEKNIINCG